jgi:hypothetical protein
MRKLSVNSFLDEEKDKVTLDVEFQSLPDGTNCVADTLLGGDAKQITVKVQNVDYKRAEVEKLLRDVLEENHEVFIDSIADVVSSLSVRERSAKRVPYDGEARSKGD